ncbi:tat-interactive protein [Coprinopsis cinerea AmutBmut pab1-1]|nr:tat-interactive protein [Coprinopsis cinerea AmutBmut pab1-1]
MPPLHVVQVQPEGPVYVVTGSDGTQKRAHVLERTDDRCFVHYIGEDKRLDAWVPESCCIPEQDPRFPNDPEGSSTTAGRKRKRGHGGRDCSASPGHAEHDMNGHGSSEAGTSSQPNDYHLQLAAQQPEEVVLTEEEYDLEQHKKITAKRNFEDVYFGDYKIKTWYYSPYPLVDFDFEENQALSAAYSKLAHPGSAPVPRATGGGRSRARASDLFAGLLNRPHGAELPNLWVCDRCLKYFSDGVPWEIHKRGCTMDHPPGQYVYKRGAHAIRELDGATQRLYCQNLSLFGKLFIDVKTLYFDLDNFLFYVLTDSDSSREHIIGFFSKEKASFDDYNLACIMTLPQYQRKGYGMLMIEFSYELSRRAKKVGTPERPLSDLGLRSYLAYWVATLIRFFRHVLSTLPPGSDGLIVKNKGNFPDLRASTPGEVVDPNYEPGKRKKARSIPPVDAPRTMFDEMDDEVFLNREFETVMEKDGSAKTHVNIRCTLTDIARACNLRVEDTAFALNECGLLMKRLAKERKMASSSSSRSGSEGANGRGVSEGLNGTVEKEGAIHINGSDGDGEMETIVITRELVEMVAQERNVKKMCIDLRYVCIGTPPKLD